MASKQGGSDNPTGKKDAGTSLANRIKGSWMGKNWQTAFILVMIIMLAFFVRAYFAWGPSVDNGYLVSGGSDSYYHETVIDHVVATGQHLVTDPMLNYPWGIRNERPPLYDWSVAVSGMSLDNLGFSLQDGVQFSLVTSTAFWGALTIIPVFLIANAVFGRKAGILASFLFALMPGHIERSVLSNADHDAMVLFFVVFAFYFFLRSLQSIKGNKWVSSWKQPKAVRSGLVSYIGQNQASLLYAALAGVCVAAVAMIWTGYVYVLIIILVYYIVQLLIDRFRNADSFGVVASMFVMWAVAFLVMFPLYYAMDYMNTWFDMPVILFTIGIVAGLVFCVTRDYPWVIVLPAVAVITIVALLAMSIFAPTIFQAVISGQGYLVKSKLYSTISEAQAPVFSTLVMSFGALSFWLALVGVGYAALKIPKALNPYFTFVVIWGAVSIYMAASAGRFLFNAAPAFAVLAGWILALLIDWIKYDEYFRNILPVIKSPKQLLRRVFQLKVVIITLLLVTLLVLPNVWTAMDAAIPSEEKKTYDKQIYNLMPSFLRPSSYDTVNGTYWYLGAFSYSLADSTTYWPAAWSWFSQRDNSSANEDKPAFMSWWDYGFEAEQVGLHPTVADNFQNGYKMAGSFICAQNETQAVSLFMLRILTKIYYEDINGVNDWSSVWTALNNNGINSSAVKLIIANPAQYTSFVLAHPEIFGTYDTSLDAENTANAMIGYEMSKAGEENIVNAYHEVRDLTGYDIGYFAIDGRLFPFSAYTQNIFYAPVKLSDRRIDAGTNDPVDFYVIKAVDNYGNEYDLDSIPADASIVSYTITYKDMFYNSMLYKAFMGYGPSDVGLTEQGIPGISGSLANYPAMQAWNMTHFRMVYRTAYYNPWPSADVQNHSSEWVAISYEEALDLQKQITNGTLNATVDMSSSALVSGVVFIQYYDGAIIRGTATSSNGEPMAGIWVTVSDEYGIPHGLTKTDANGNYELIAPFGNVSVTFSYGKLTLLTQIGTVISTSYYNITYAQAMRQDATSMASDSVAADSDPSWIINGSVVLNGGSVYGKVFIDVDGDSVYDTGSDVLLENATVKYTDKSTGYTRTTTAFAGSYYITGVPPTSSASLVTTYNGHTVNSQNITVESKANKSVQVAVKPATITQTISYPSGMVASGLAVDLVDKSNGVITTKTTDSAGKVVFNKLLPGNYTIKANNSALTLGQRDYTLAAGRSVTETNIVYDAMAVTGNVTSSGSAVPYARVGFSTVKGITWVVADANGHYQATIGKMDYTVYVLSVISGTDHVGLTTVSATSSTNLDLSIGAATVLQGYVKNGNSTVPGAKVLIKSPAGASISGQTNTSGGFRFLVPAGDYSVYALNSYNVFWGTVTAGTGNISISEGALLKGRVWTDVNQDGSTQSTEYFANVTVVLTSSNGLTLTTLTDSKGNYTLAVPMGLDYTMQFVQQSYDTVTLTFPAISANQTNTVQMVGTLRDVSGDVIMVGGSAQPGITINFVAKSSTAVNATVTSDGLGHYSVQLRPGKYVVSVVQDIIAGDSNSQYQNRATKYLNISIGQSAVTDNVDIVVRYKVNGTITPVNGTVRIGYPGPESFTVSNAASYSTYLRAGNYSVYCTDSNDYSILTRLNVTGPTSYDIMMVAANRTDIDARYNGTAVLSIMTIQVINPLNGALVNLTSNIAGTVSVYLPAGSYNASTDLRILNKVDGYASKKYVRYTAFIGFNSDAPRKNVEMPLAIALDNATVTGLPAATYHFVALTSTAISTDLTVAGPIALAPGNYSAYAIDGANQAFFGTITVTPYVSNSPSVALTQAYSLSGSVLLNGAGKSANITIAKGSAYYNITADASGAYSILLPAGTYALTASTTLVDQGVNVVYRGSEPAGITASPVVVNINLSRVTQYAATLTWDGVKQTVAQGETATYTVRVRNTGSMTDTYNLTATATGWNITITPNKIENLTYGSAGYVDVTVAMTPGKTIMVDHTKVSLKLTSSNGAKDSIFMDVNIAETREISLVYSAALAQTNNSHVYNVLLTNSGTVDEKYNVTIDNLSELEAKGWNVTIRSGTAGKYSTGLVNITLDAGKNVTLQISMVGNDTPDKSVSITLTAASATVSKTLTFAAVFPDLGIPDNGFTVTGTGVTTTLPSIPLETFIALGLVGVLAVLTIYYMFKKGVLGRRK